MIIISLVASMAITLYLVKKKINIGYALMIGSIILAISSGLGIQYIIEVFFKTFTDYDALSLSFAIGLITILGYLMDKYHLMDRMVESLEAVLQSSKATILLAPAMIGTLLVTGGALMSCPVVKNLAQKLNIPDDKAATINQIFRHGLYFVYPLAPPMILASQLGEFKIGDFILLQLPISIAMYLFGYFYLLRNYKEEKREERLSLKGQLVNLSQFIKNASPILASIIGTLVFKLPFFVALILGILLSIVLYKDQIKKDPTKALDESIWQTIKTGFRPNMVIAILGIMIFKNVVRDLDELFVVLSSWLELGIPIELLIIVTAGLLSFPMASAQPSIAILYPLILPLAPDYDTKLLYAMFIYTSGFMAYFISPLHMCQVLTLEYFNVNMKKLYQNYVYLLPAIFGVMVTIYFVNRAI